jgi:hypothetical protein
MALFMVFNLLIGPVLFLSLVVSFQVFSSHFPVTALGLDLFSGTYLSKLVFLCSPVIENISL